MNENLIINEFENELVFDYYTHINTQFVVKFQLTNG